MYSGKTVLITGSSRGIGHWLVNHFLQNGAKVIGITRSIGYDATNYRHFVCDLSKAEQIEKTFAEIKAFLDGEKIDIVINNAAVMTSQYAIKLKTIDADSMIKTNLLAPFIVSREAVALMYGSPHPRIINIGSMADAVEAMGDSVYAACKAGLRTMTHILAKEFVMQKITVNVVAVSAIETDMLKQHKPEVIEKIKAMLPIHRLATMDDIYNVVDFFCSENSDYITGQTIYLGGING